MKRTIIKMWGEKTIGIHELADIFKKEIHAELVSENWRNMNGLSIVLLSYEKYYFRTGSYASLAVMLTETEDRQTADVIGYGGGEGMLGIDWGANSNFAKRAEELLLQNGFHGEY